MIDPTELSSPSFLPPGTFGSATGWICCVGLLGVGLGLVILYLFALARSLHLVQEHEQALLHEGAEKPLFRGPSRVVLGRVDLDGGDDVAIGIEILQRVKNHRSRSSTWHTWDELSRKARVAPFYLVRDDGVCVYVDPGEDALVVDSLATKYPTDMPSHRLRSADVRRGKTFFAYGELVEGAHARSQDGYRGGTGWILRAPKGGRMLLATEAMRDRYAARISFLRTSALWLSLAFCALHGVFTVPFVAATLFGAHATAEVTGLSTYTTTNKGHTTTHYVLTVRADDGFTFKDTVFGATYAEVRAAKNRGGVVVPIVRTGTWTGASYLGDEPYVYGGWVILGILGSVITLLILRFTYPTKFAWYDQRKLSERGGTGYWRETRPGMPIEPGGSGV